MMGDTDEVAERREIKCYDCKDCHVLPSNANSVRCVAGCCYSAVLKIDENTTETIRQCVKIIPGQMCYGFCQHLQTDHLYSHPNGSMLNCEVCHTDNCNSGILNEEMDDDGDPEFKCYMCKHCLHVTTSTPRVSCKSRCCITMISSDKGINVERACAELRGVSCKNYCTRTSITHKIHYCEVCNLNRCNFAAPPYGAMNSKDIFEETSCYNCMGCYNVNINDTIKCPDGCCLTAVWTEFGGVSGARYCADLQGIPCQNYCRYLTNQLKNVEEGKMNYCRTCFPKNCNSEPAPTRDGVTSRDRIKSKCYDCENCEKVNGTTTDSIDCPSACCYSILKYSSKGTRATIRGCAQVLPGIPCNYFCSYAEKLHLESHPTGSVSFCETCATRQCNDQFLDTAETGVTVESTVVTNCYECDDCYAIVNETATPCDIGCCTTLIWKENNDKRLSRSCVAPDQTPCTEYCKNVNRIVLDVDPNGIIEHCGFCRHDKCNLLRASAFEQGRTMGRTIKCYNCANCLEVSNATTTIECPSGCCISTVVMDAKNVTSHNRGCERYKPGRTCNDKCDFYKTENRNENKTTKHCSSCMEDLCNKEDLKTVEKDDTNPSSGKKDEISTTKKDDNTENTGQETETPTKSDLSN